MKLNLTNLNSFHDTPRKGAQAIFCTSHNLKVYIDVMDKTVEQYREQLQGIFDTQSSDTTIILNLTLLASSLIKELEKLTTDKEK